MIALMLTLAHPAHAADGTVMVIVAALDLPPGHLVRTEDLYAVEYPVDTLYDGVFLDPRHVVGRVVTGWIHGNELVVAQRLGPTVSRVFPEGRHVVALPARLKFHEQGPTVDLVRTDEGCTSWRGLALFPHALGQLVLAPEQVGPVVTELQRPQIQAVLASPHPDCTQGGRAPD